jgi:C-terminal processing protease CtpA/Prc
MIFRNKSKNVVILFFVLGLSVHLNAQKAKTSNDSIDIFYNQLFSNLKKVYLHRKSVDWKSVESETAQNLKNYGNFKNSLSEIKVLFGKIGATHCTVYKEQSRYSMVSEIRSKENFSEQWKRKFDAKPGFEIKIIDGKYGYILMPKMSFLDMSPENIHKIAQPLYDQIAEIKAKNKLEGWIIDLRFNTGGNSEPMLLSLYDFLGDRVIWGSLDVDKNRQIK